MPVKRAVNTKVAAANEKKAVHKAKVDGVKASEKEAKTATDWAKGSNLRGKSKEDQAEMARQLADEKKALKDAAAAADEEEAGKVKVKKVKKIKNDLPPELAAIMAKEKAKKKKVKGAKGPLKVAQQAAADKLGNSNKKAKDEDEWQESCMPQQNVNRQMSTEAASGLDSAMDQLSVGAGVDSHPERRMKAAFKGWEERNLPRVKDENKGMKLSQYKEILFKEWKKSPENPMNQGA
jgi:hypothetical protein